MPFLSLLSNPIWKAKQFVMHIGVVQQGTAWAFDQYGFVSGAQGRELSAQEASWVAGYNTERGALNQANRDAVDAIMQRVLPLSDVLYYPQDSLKTMRAIDSISWLNDHEMGSAFYNDPNNYNIDPDSTADYAMQILLKFLYDAGLEVDMTELGEKVANGVSTPVVIDLDGDGISTTSFLAGPSVYFDINGDGQQDRTAWISGDDAFLAVDSNKNGVIDGVNELFGGQGRGAGFAKLAQFDSNGDGVVDQHDEKFSDLLLWRDANSDGISDMGELVSASIAGLESININFISQDVYQNGNLLGEVSTAVFQGKAVDAIDVHFRHSNGIVPQATESFESIFDSFA